MSEQLDGIVARLDRIGGVANVSTVLARDLDWLISEVRRLETVESRERTLLALTERVRNVIHREAMWSDLLHDFQSLHDLDLFLSGHPLSQTHDGNSRETT